MPRNRLALVIVVDVDFEGRQERHHDFDDPDGIDGQLQLLRVVLKDAIDVENVFFTFHLTAGRVWHEDDLNEESCHED